MSTTPDATAPPETKLSADEAQRIADLIYRWIGMIFGQNKRPYIPSRVADRVRPLVRRSMPFRDPRHELKRDRVVRVGGIDQRRHGG